MKTSDSALPPSLLARLQTRYAEPHRHYHTMTHVEALLRWLRTYRQLATAPDDIEAAIWFHDAIYDTRRSDNETRSAELARKELAALHWKPDRIDRVAAMVKATRHHHAADSDIDTWLFLDMDLSVLAAPPDTYTDYSRAIRAEFAWVSDAEYRNGRSRVLQSFLRREFIYRTPALQTSWEAAARANLQQELVVLQGGSA